MLSKRSTRISALSALLCAGAMSAAASSPLMLNAPFKAVATHTDNGPELYGWVSNYPLWNKDAGQTYGIYSFSATTDSPLTFVTKTANASQAAYAEGLYCGFTDMSAYGYVSYNAYDADNGEVVTTRRINESALSGTGYTLADFSVQAMAYDYSSRTLYGVYYNDDQGKLNLRTIDPMTGNPGADKIILQATRSLVTVAFDGEGNLFGIDTAGSLVKINTSTGAVSTVGNTTVTPAAVPQGSTIDTTTGTLYWACLKPDYSAGLYAVGISNAAANLISEWPAQTSIVGLHTAHPATGDVPATVTDLNVTYSAPGATSGTITFTAPAKTASGKALSGNLSMELRIDRSKVSGAQSTIAPGAKFTLDRTFTEGSHVVEVILKNNAGYADEARIHTFTGADVPAAVGNLDFTLSGLNATLTWEAPTTGANGGWIDTQLLTYKVVRQPDNVLVANGLGGTTYKGQIPDDYANWFYEVTAVTTNPGATALSNAVTYGTAKKVPYKETFPTAYPLDLFTTVDANDDDETWRWENGYMANNGYFANATGADDWLITPPIALTTDWIYSMKVTARSFSSYYTETFETAFGTTDKPSDLTVNGTFSVNDPAGITFTSIVEPAANGNYRLAIHHNTPASSPRENLMIDCIELVPYISTAAPAAADNATIAKAADNNLKGTLSFTVAKKAINGTALTTVEKVEIYLDNELLDTKTDATPGKAYSLEVDVPQGVHIFNIVAYNEAGRGHDCEVSTFGGIDIPGAVKNLRYVWDSSDDNKATLVWDAPDAKGQNGFDIDLPSVTYSVLQPFFGSMYPEKTSLTTTSYAISTNMTSQGLATRGVQAVSKGGTGTGALISINLGAPIPPHAESFAGGSVKYAVWTVASLNGSASWGMSNSNPTFIEAQDGDNGFAICSTTAAEGGESRLIGPAIDFSDTSTKYLHFHIYHKPGVNPANMLTMEYTTNGSDYEQLGQPVPVMAGPQGWAEYVLPLDRLAGTRKAIIALRGNVTDPNSWIAVDNMEINDNPAGIGTVAATVLSGITVEGGNGCITVKGGEGETVAIYTPDGRLAASQMLTSDVQSVAVASAGVYLVKAGNMSVKTIVK